jgi:hypothetical protein
MGLVTNVTDTIQLPDGEWADIRKLSHKQLKEAAKVRRSEGFETMREIGAELIKAMRDSVDTADLQEKVKRIQDAQAADVHNYDRDVLLKKGLVSWTYPDAPLPDATDDLDDPTAEFLAERIFLFSRPPSPAVAEAERKNG